MEKIESDFIETALKLRDSYRRKLQRLEGIISEWPGESKKPEPQASKINFLDPNLQDADLKTPSMSDSTSDWILYAIQANPTRFSNPTIKAKLKEIAPEIAERISGGRISTQLYHLAKSGQIAVIRKIPGGASEYQTTSQFKPWVRWSGVALTKPLI